VELKEENIKIDDYMKDFDNNIQKLNNLKNKIENEMIEIDKRYEKVDDEVTNSYEIKLEKLKKEENDLKENLQTEVTKIKEILENYLSDIYYLQKICEKIIIGIKSLQNEEKNIYKTLSYISKINKNEKEMKNIFQGFMKNIIINYIESESTIKYEEYYFNGIPSPENIEIKDIKINGFKILWIINNNNLNIDEKDFKYKIKIRKENSNEDYKEINVDSNNYIINKLEKNTNYEIKLCTIYKDIIMSNYTELYKIKTKNFDIDSVILSEVEKGNEYLNKLYEWTGYNKMELIYRGTRDGSNSNIFHNKCDNQGPTICLFKNDKGNIFGGYTSISWESPNKGQWKFVHDSFIFTLTNIYGTVPIKYPNIDSRYSVYHHPNYGPTFGGGCEIYLYDDFSDNNNISSSNIGHSYLDVLGKGCSIFTGDENNDNHNFILKELEVFMLSY
jgi:hypothetical protein